MASVTLYVRVIAYNYKLEGQITNRLSMATSKLAGYECEIVSSTKEEEYFCKQCKRVAREANTMTCCGKTFCKECIETIIRKTKVCPNCENDQQRSVEHNTTLQTKILALEVRCSKADDTQQSSCSCEYTSNMFMCMFPALMRCHKKVQACQWTGPLKDLDAHTCYYVDEECSKSSGENVQKRNVETCAKECPKRDNQCLNMTFCGVFQHFTDYQDHSHGCLGNCEDGPKSHDVKVSSEQKVPVEMTKELIDEQLKEKFQGRQEKLPHESVQTVKTTVEEDFFEKLPSKKQEEFRRQQTDILPDKDGQIEDVKEKHEVAISKQKEEFERHRKERIETTNQTKCRKIPSTCTQGDYQKCKRKKATQQNPPWKPFSKAT